MDTAWIIWSFIFGLIGAAAFVYGRQQRRSAALIVGIALMVYPYFVSSIIALVGIGLLLVAGLVWGQRIEDRL